MYKRADIRERLAQAWQAGSSGVNVILIDDLRLDGVGTRVEWSLDSGATLEPMDWFENEQGLAEELQREVRLGTGFQIRLNGERVDPDPKRRENDPNPRRRGALVAAREHAGARIELHQGNAAYVSPSRAVWAEGRTGEVKESLPSYREPVGRGGIAAMFWVEIVVGRGAGPVEWDGDTIGGALIDELRGKAKELLDETIREDDTLMKPGGPVRRLPKLGASLTYEGTEHWRGGLLHRLPKPGVVRSREGVAEWQGECGGAILSEGAISGLARAQGWRIGIPLYAPWKVDRLGWIRKEPWFQEMRTLESVKIEIWAGEEHARIDHDLEEQEQAPEWDERVVLARHRAENWDEACALESDRMELVLGWRHAEEQWETRQPIEHALVPWDRDWLGLEDPAGEWAYLRCGGPASEAVPTVEGLRAHLWRTIGGARGSGAGADTINQRLTKAAEGWLA